MGIKKLFPRSIKLYVTYLWRFRIRKKPHVLSRTETLNRVLEDKVSLARYGDGELCLMMDEGFGFDFQRFSPALQKDLRRCFSLRNPRLLICLTDAMCPEDPLTAEAQDYYRHFLASNYRKYSHLLDMNYDYGNTNITRLYLDSYLTKPREKVLREIDLWEAIFANRNILIVEGRGTKVGCKTNLFLNSQSIRRIICPVKNAYDCLEKIRETVIQHYSPNDLICLSLGPTATVLATILSCENGIQCLDIGNLETECIWFFSKVTKRTRIANKYVDEASKIDDGDLLEIPETIANDSFEGQIIAQLD